MLKAILHAYLRRRRPLRDHNFLVLPHLGLAYGRCPNAASEDIRQALLRLTAGSGGEPFDTDDFCEDEAADEMGADAGEDACASYATGTLASWADGLNLLSGRQLVRRHPRALVFSVVRDPLTRLAACFHRMRTEAAPPPGADRAFRPGNDFPGFVARVCAMPDWKSPNAYRSQTAILTHKARLLPSRVLRHETGEADWQALRAELSHACGVDIGPLPGIRDPHGETIAALVAEIEPALRLSVRRRYAADYRNFYEGTALALPVIGAPG
ncbi:sulfotransferase family 2 domain-containing protein [Stappia indica]|uniref:Sulfotransferase family protein n=1 Tax=Stappia indica TaxID=538381 RepID=A0A857C2Z2_9HYPH|nr:sulfotransferase family 2 domain-containing protein [Stappia indica]QGZ33396.1 hypothetical protein GH266_02100 [Stappia indica]